EAMSLQLQQTFSSLIIWYHSLDLAIYKEMCVRAI
ncbi:MAG: hypothetical protein ACI837_003101, partial [Crocinitomicaceae bacterium]